MEEALWNGIRMLQPQRGFRLGTDSVLLAEFLSLPPRAKIADLGAGCATLGLLLCAGNERCRVTGIELNQNAHRAALQNIQQNRLDPRMESICADLGRVPVLFAPGSFDCCISNPPYFSGGPASQFSSARREDCCTLAALMASAGWALKYGGDLFLVHRPERLGEIIAQGAPHKLEAKALTLVRHREDGPVALVLLKLRKGAKPGLTIHELSLHHRDGSPTKEYQEIYHIRED